MQIPERIEVGRTSYRIHLTPRLAPSVLGCTAPYMGTIEIALRQHGVQRTNYDLSETFWHEATHCILRDMGHPHWADEVFVTQFSQRLNQLVHTAKMKDENGTA